MIIACPETPKISVATDDEFDVRILQDLMDPVLLAVISSVSFFRVRAQVSHLSDVQWLG